MMKSRIAAQKTGTQQHQMLKTYAAGSTRSTIATKLKYIQSIPILLSCNHKTKAPRKHPPTHKQRI
jgi:hypothetical protein